MHPPLNNDTKHFWSLVHTKKKVYPFWATTQPHTPQSVLIPRFFGVFIRLPLPDKAYWGFKDEEKRNIFIQRYGAEEWTP